MNTERLFKTVMMDLSSTQAKLEDKLETTINSEIELSQKSAAVQKLLIELVQIEMAMTKFNSMLIQNNNENTNTQENGSK